MKDYWYYFGINGKKRLIPILWYQNDKNRRLYRENLGRGTNQPHVSTLVTKNPLGRRGLQDLGSIL